MMATKEREDVIVCSKCLDDWSPKHWSHGQPLNESEMIRRWREELVTNE